MLVGEAWSGDETYSAADAMKASMLRFQSARRLWLGLGLGLGFGFGFGFGLGLAKPKPKLKPKPNPNPNPNPYLEPLVRRSEGAAIECGVQGGVADEPLG